MIRPSPILSPGRGHAGICAGGWRKSAKDYVKLFIKQFTSDEIIEVLRSLFQTGLARPGHGYVWAEWAGIIMDMNAQALLPELRQAFSLELVDESVIDLDYIEECFRLEGNTLLERFAGTHRPVSAQDIAFWPSYTEEDKKEGRLLPLSRDDLVSIPEVEEYLESLEADLSSIYDLPSVPYIAPLKPGRNDPCPCGSGKKFKKCCGKT